MNKVLFYDFETSGGLDINDVGSARYIKEATPTWIAWAADDGPIEVRKWGEEAHQEFGEQLMCSFTLAAQNAVFDLLVLRHHDPDLYKLALGPEGCKLACTACMARYLNIPASLADMADYFGMDPKLEIDHNPGGLFSQEDEAKWREYVAHDVRLLRDIHRTISKRVPTEETELIDLHLRMQTRGVAIDEARLNELGKAAAKEMKQLDGKFKTLTGFTPTQTVRLGEWFNRECGVSSASTKKLTEAAESGKWSDRGREAYDLLMKRKANEFVKLKKVKEQMVDGELTDTLKHANTVTNRWAGNGAHLHNFSRDGQARSIVVAHEGMSLVRADLSQIEVRVGLWIAGMKEALTDLHEHDWYLNLTKDIYGPDHDAAEMKQLRHGVKQGVIGAMYSGGVEAVRRAIGPKATMDQAAFVLSASKKRMAPAIEKSKEMFSVWKDVADSKKGTVRHVAVGVGGGETVIIGRPKVGIRSSDDDIILVACPRGRLIYRDVRKTKMGDWQYTIGTRPKFMKHPGTLMENIASTIAREVLAAGLLRLGTTYGMTPVATVHDEVLVEASFAAFEHGNPDETVRAMMTKPVDGLKGLLLDSESAVRSAWKER